MSKGLRISLIAIAALVAIVAAIVIRSFRSELNTPIETLTATTLYEVPRGSAWPLVFKDLQKRGYISSAREIALWMRMMRPNAPLRAGEYELEPGMTPIDVVELFNSGKVYLHKITIVEGTTFKELRAMLRTLSSIKPEDKPLTGAALMKKLGSTSTYPEGWFYPDTYLFPKGTTDIELLRLAYDRMRKELTNAWSSRDAGLPLANEYEALTLASIVEKETALASERPQIAGVFIERLRKGMRLQTDPTVIYGIGDQYDGNIRKADLLRDTPYNTYTRPGLPPTPICLPSAAALDAVVHPKQTGALFFVATGKGDGSHYFSKTLEEHNAALQRYLQTLRHH